jgi:hypothetical protein
MSLISDSAGIFLASDPTQGVRFQLWPEDITDIKSVNWAPIEVIGRSEPIMTYHSSSSQQFSFTLMFASSIDQADQETPEKVRDRVNFLKSLAYPIKTRAGFTTFPPVVLLIVGDLINSRCVVTSVEANWRGPWSLSEVVDLDVFGAVGGSGLAVAASLESIKSVVSLPIVATVKISMITVHQTPLTHETVRLRGDRLDGDINSLLTGNSVIPGGFGL